MNVIEWLDENSPCIGVYNPPHFRPSMFECHCRLTHKINVIERLEFELAFNNTAGQHISHNTMRTPLALGCINPLPFRPSMFECTCRLTHKINVIERLEFELAYNNTAGQHISHNTMRTPLALGCINPLPFRPSMFECHCRLTHKANVIAWLEFEFGYYEGIRQFMPFPRVLGVTVQHISHDVMESLNLIRFLCLIACQPSWVI